MPAGAISIFSVSVSPWSATELENILGILRASWLKEHRLLILLVCRRSGRFIEGWSCVEVPELLPGGGAFPQGDAGWGRSSGRTWPPWYALLTDCHDLGRPVLHPVDPGPVGSPLRGPLHLWRWARLVILR